MPEMTENETPMKKQHRKKNRETHNAVERHRKKKINAGINRIGELIPCSPALKQATPSRSQYWEHYSGTGIRVYEIFNIMQGGRLQNVSITHCSCYHRTLDGHQFGLTAL
ncbi:basic helix-loop-helix domain-containing protein USF3 isoform X2 [Eretmochelys imbricata]